MAEAVANYTIHDFLHSWNGKYRRPEGLATPNFQTPAITSGMWVYEGLTDYLTNVMTARAGIWTKEEFLDALASKLPTMIAVQVCSGGILTTSTRWHIRFGALKIPVTITGVSTALISMAKGPWSGSMSTRRSATSRTGRSRLTTLWLSFTVSVGIPAPEVPYSLDDIVACLNQVVPNDWEGFLNERLHALSKAPLQGISGAGYRLVYKEGADDDFRYSLAMSIKADGVISDVFMREIAYQAGFGPGMKILAVDRSTLARAQPCSRQSMPRRRRRSPSNSRLTILA